MCAAITRAVSTGRRRKNVPVPIDGSWVLTFDEEFSGAIDSVTKWRYQNPYGTTTTAAGQPWDQDEILSSNVTVSSGMANLAITKPAGGTPGGKTYGSGTLTSRFTQTYGYFETRCKMPRPTPGTNVLRNPTVTGAVAGQPGTVPTNWAVVGGSGLRRTVAGSGTDAYGWKYVDIRFEGTTTDTFIAVAIDNVSGAGTGSPVTVATYSATARLSLASGSLFNISSISFQIDAYQSDGVTTTGFLTAGNAVTSLSNASYTPIGGNVVFPANTARAGSYLKINYASGKNICFTLRISNPQLGLAASGNGIYSAVWMVENNLGPREMDLAQFFGIDPATLRTGYTKSNGTSVTANNSGDWYDDFHVYGLLWTPSSNTFYLDGRQILTTTSDICTAPCAIALTNATAGSTWNINGNIVDATTQFPATMTVDYVHVYASSGTAVTPDAGYGGPGDNG